MNNQLDYYQVKEVVSENYLKEEHASLVNENLCIFSTLKEKVDIVECGACLILKLKIEKLKGQIINLTRSPSATFIVQVKKGHI